MRMTDKFEAQLGEIRARFEAGLDEKLAAAAAALHRAASARLTQAERATALAELRMFAHDLAGLSPSLGFAELGERASRLEEVVLTAMRAGDPGLTMGLPQLSEAFLSVASAIPARQGGARTTSGKETAQ